MIQIGYALSSEEHSPNDLVRHGRRAEEVGFTFAMISDHYHPWIEAQGHAPFVWNVIGGIAAVTERIRLGTGVTCPTFRIHPAIIAQAAATAAAMMPGRFILGLGSGEALNEHILGDHWPPADMRLDMLDEAVEIIRILWEGEESTYYGDYYTVENARLFTLPEENIPIYIAASGSTAAELAGTVGDGLVSTTADPDVVKAFDEAAGEKLPKVGQVKVCLAATQDEALETVAKIWPTGLVPGAMKSDLPTPDHFEQLLELVKKEDLLGTMPMGPEAKPVLEEIQKMIDAGYDHVYVHQIGPDQERLFEFAQKEIFPNFR